MFAISVQTMNLFGHTMVRAGDLWVSQAPFTNIDWQSNVDRLCANHQRYGVLTQTRVGDEVRHSLHCLSSLAALRDTFGVDRVKKGFGGNSVIYSEGGLVSAFEFFVLKGQEMDRRLMHPVTGVTYDHALAMCLAIGAGLMTAEQYELVVKGPEGNRKHATPNGELFGPDGEEYVHSSIKTQKKGTADVEDTSRPDGPWGTRDYTGNVWKWMKVDPKKEYELRIRGGSWSDDDPEYFAVSYSLLSDPEGADDTIGFLAARPARD